MMQNDRQSSSRQGRLTNDLFNQFTYFGKLNDTNKLLSPTLSFFNSHHQMSAGQFINLFMQSAILDAFLSQRFPDIFHSSSPIQSVIENMLHRLSDDNDMLP